MKKGVNPPAAGTRKSITMIKDFTFLKGWSYDLEPVIAAELVERGYARMRQPLPLAPALPPSAAQPSKSNAAELFEEGRKILEERRK